MTFVWERERSVSLIAFPLRPHFLPLNQGYPSVCLRTEEGRQSVREMMNNMILEN
jgi:hypothetical protein